MKLHLGCGSVRLPGYINIDLVESDAVDVVMDVRHLTYEDNSVDLIYASHVLDHVSRHEVDDVLREWYRVLKKGGLLRVAVSDFEVTVKLYLAGIRLERLWGSIVGGQKQPCDQHGCVFDYDTLSFYLYRNGFCNVHRYDWRDTIHKDFDDYSQAYLPFMDKENGILTSLNVEGLKGEW